jgi:hypothetical protein
MRQTIMLLGGIAFCSWTGLGQANTGWTTMIDAREQAFSIDVPTGWNARGGMFRFNTVDARPFVDMNSPDGRINIRIGDASIPSYDLPSPALQRLRSISPFVAPYATGDQFAAKYGQARFKTMCQNVQVTHTGQNEPTWGRGTASVRMTAGWAGFSCVSNGQPAVAFVYAETLVVEPTFGSAGHWYVITLGSVIAPAAEGKAAGDMLAHSYKSIGLNPAWMRNQAQMIAAVRQGILNAAAMVQRINAAAQQNFQRNMKMITRQADNFNDVLLGQTYARDSSGQRWVVQTGTGGTQWVDARGVVKESALVPGPGYKQLTPISH